MVCDLCKMFLELGLRILVNEPSVRESLFSSTLGPASGLSCDRNRDRVQEGAHFSGPRGPGSATISACCCVFRAPSGAQGHRESLLLVERRMLPLMQVM